MPPPTALQPLPDTTPLPPTASPPAGVNGLQHAIDKGHAFLGGIFATVIGFDRFFSDERQLEAERDRSFLRWRNDLTLRTDRHLVYGPSVVADIRLPGLNRWMERFRLTVEGASEDTIGPPPPPTTPAGPSPTVSQGVAGVRYVFVETMPLQLDAAAGALLQLPPGAIVRTRIRLARPVGSLFLVRASENVFWRTDLHLGQTTQLELQHALSRAALIRLSSSATISMRDRALGFQWNTELAWIQGLGPRTASALGVGSDGITRPAPLAKNPRVFARLRRDLYQGWCFGEIEPELVWAYEPGAPRQLAPGVILRFEVQFQGGERPETPIGDPEPQGPR
jgi:hypothetical protein